MLVVSNGDDELLELGAERRGWHFPQMEDGTYAGYHPADSAEAIAHCEALRGAGRGVHRVPGDRALVAQVLCDLLVKRGGSRSKEPDSDCESCVVLSLLAHSESGLEAHETGSRSLAPVWDQVPNSLSGGLPRVSITDEADLGLDSWPRGALEEISPNHWESVFLAESGSTSYFFWGRAAPPVF